MEQAIKIIDLKVYFSLPLDNSIWIPELSTDPCHILNNLDLDVLHVKYNVIASVSYIKYGELSPEQIAYFCDGH